MRHLRAQAAARRRSVNSEAIDLLEPGVQATPIDPEGLLAWIRSARITPRRTVGVNSSPVPGRQAACDGRRRRLGGLFVLLAHASGCSAFDCAYVVPAENLGVPLVTADRAVFRASPDRAVSPRAFLA